MTAVSNTTTAPAPPRLAEDLVFDVGMHRGEDSVYYLRKGFRVVAFEAQPDLVEVASTQFATEIAGGRLVIVSGAIVRDQRDSVTFYTHSRMSTWGTTEPARARRNEVMGPSSEITVPCVNFACCLRDYGVPHYIKIDIEAADMLCLEALLDVDPGHRPRYASIEAESETWSGVVRQFDLLERLGYSRFAIVQQARIGHDASTIVTRDGSTVPYRFQPYSSGPFGEDIAVRWLSKADAMRRYLWILLALRTGNAFDRLVPKGPEIRWLLGLVVQHPLPGWFDIHAAR